MEDNRIEDDRLDSQTNDINILKEKYTKLQNRTKYFIDSKSELSDRLNEFKYKESDSLNDIIENIEAEESYEQKIVKADEYINSLNDRLVSEKLEPDEKESLEKEISTLGRLKGMYTEISNIEKEQSELYSQREEYMEEYNKLASEYESQGKSLDELEECKLEDISGKSLDEQMEMYDSYVVKPKYTEEELEAIALANELQQEEKDAQNKVKNDNKKEENKKDKKKKGFIKKITFGIAAFAAVIAGFVGGKKALPEPDNSIDNNNNKLTDIDKRKFTKALSDLDRKYNNKTNTEKLLSDYAKESEVETEEVIEEVTEENTVKSPASQKPPKPVDVSGKGNPNVLPSEDTVSISVEEEDSIVTDIKDESSTSVSDKENNEEKNDIKDKDENIEIKDESDDVIVVIPDVPKDKVEDKDNIQSDKKEEVNDKEEIAGKEETTEKDDNITSIYDDMENPYAGSEDMVQGVSKLSEYLQNQTYTEKQQVENATKNINKTNQKSIENKQKSR